MKFLDTVEKFRKGSLGQKYLNELKGTKTEQAFINAGRSAWGNYWEGGYWPKFINSLLVVSASAGI